MSLKKEAVGGVFWTFLQQFGSQIINFGISIILARLLLPKDFGTIALMDVVIGVGTIIIASGLGSSLIRTKDADDRDYSTVFYFNFVASIIMYAIAFFIAPLFSSFYEIPMLTPLIRVYSLSFIIGAFTSVQRTILVKNMEFKKQMIIELPSLIISGIVGISMAYTNFGVWALIGSSLSFQIARSIQYWFYSKWIPKLIFDRAKFKQHFSFGSNLLMAGIINTLFQSAYPLIIGKYFTVSDLGYYNRANSIKQLPISNISAALNKVTYPLFAKIKDNDATLKNAYIKLMKMVIFVVAPVMFFVIVYAEPIIRFLLGDKWLEAVPFLQILSLSAILYPIHQYNLNILNVKGRSDLFLKLDIIKKFVLVITILISMQFGMIGLAWGQVASSIIALFINSFYSGKFINLTLWIQVKMLIPSIIISAFLAGAVYLIKQNFLFGLMDIVNITIGGIIFFLAYIILNFILKNDSLEEIKILFRERKNYIK